MLRFKQRNNNQTDDQLIAQAVEEDLEIPYDPEYATIEYLRSLDKKDYEKIIKKVEIYRDADEAVAKLDSKKVTKKVQELVETEFVEA